MTASPTPCFDGWVYPCTLEEIKAQIERIPADYVEGIAAIGLCRSTNRDHWANARYFYGKQACTRIYSWNDTLSLRLPAHTKHHLACRYLDREVEYGMEIEPAGPRLIVRWQPENLKRFMLEHVLLHEIGHHVFYKKRISQGLHFQPCTESEKFAEDFARRYKRNEEKHHVHHP